MHFHPALGDPEGLNERERGLFESEGFFPAPSHCESPKQSFTAFLESEPAYPQTTANVCYLQTLPTEGVPLEFTSRIGEFIETFFGWPVAPRHTTHVHNANAWHSPKKSLQSPQLWAADVCSELRYALPADAYCAVSLAFVDLYPESSMAFVFAHRASPAADLFSYFHSETSEHGVFPNHLWPACSRILAHELCHLLGMQHCCFFRCLMNPTPHPSSTSGTTSLAQWDCTVLLCPVCLRKLAYACALDVRRRYQKLAGLLERLGFVHEPQWIRNRLSRTPGAFPFEWSPG